MKNILYALVTLPLILIVALSVFEPFSASSRTPFEQTITADVLGVLDTSPKTFTTTYPVKEGTLTVYAVNTTDNSAVTITVDSVDYKDGLEPAIVTVSSTTTGTDIEVRADYTGYAKSGYDQYVKTYKGTISSFNLAGLLPFIVIALAVVAAVVGIAIFK